MKKKISGKVNIQLQKEDLELITKIIETEESNVESYRIGRKQEKSDYEKRLEVLTQHLATQL